jgi:hypothetical protein
MIVAEYVALIGVGALFVYMLLITAGYLYDKYLKKKH